MAENISQFLKKLRAASALLEHKKQFASRYYNFESSMVLFPSVSSQSAVDSSHFSYSKYEFQKN